MTIKFLLIILTLLAIAYSLTLSFYDIKFNTGAYDILFTSRRNYNCGWGLNYKEGFEVWQFTENIIYPRYSKNSAKK